MKRSYLFYLVCLMGLCSIAWFKVLSAKAIKSPEMQKQSFANYKNFRSFFLKKISSAKHEIQVVSDACSDRSWLRKLRKAKKRGVKVAFLQKKPSCTYLAKHEIAANTKPNLKVFAAPLVVQVDQELLYASHDMQEFKGNRKLLVVKAPTRLWASYKEQFALATEVAAVAPPVYRSGAYQAGKPAMGSKMKIPATQEHVTRSNPTDAYNYDKSRPSYRAPQGVAKALPKQPVYKKLGRSR